MDLIKIAEEAFATKKELPSFKSGDTITVAYRIKEGNKERIQQYRGVVIRISGHGDKKRFTVRKMSENVGVERIFPIESPFIESITQGKPDPMCYLLAAKDLNVSPEDCIVFEDSFNGIQSGKDAGMRVIGLSTTNPAESLRDKVYEVIPNFEKVTFEDYLRW